VWHICLAAQTLKTNLFEVIQHSLLDHFKHLKNWRGMDIFYLKKNQLLVRFGFVNFHQTSFLLLLHIINKQLKKKLMDYSII
jgi:hypothetical protein